MQALPQPSPRRPIAGGVLDPVTLRERVQRHIRGVPQVQSLTAQHQIATARARTAVRQREQKSARNDVFVPVRVRIAHMAPT